MKLVLPDVNLLLAFAWENHGRNTEARKWLFGLEAFATCPIVELGFIRVSMSPAYSADWDDAISVLTAVQGMKAAARIDDDLNAADSPKVGAYKHTTDAYLVGLAESHGMKLATLDKGILKATWAKNTAYNPLDVI